MSSDAVGTTSLKSSAHVKAAGWGRGLSTLLRITRMNLRHPGQAALAIGSTIAAVILQVLIPQLLGDAIDQTKVVLGGGATGAAAEQALWVPALLLLAASTLRGLFTMAQNYFAEAVGHHVAYELRLAFYDKVQRLSFSFHDRVHSGDLITLGILDLDGVRMYFSTALVRLLLLTMLIGIGGYRMISTDTLLGFIALSFVPFVAWRSSITQVKLRAIWLNLQERLSVLGRVMEENLAGIRVVRAFSAQAYEMAKFDRASKNALEVAHQQVDVYVPNTSAMTLAFFLAMGLVLWIGCNKVIVGQISVGTLTMFLAFMTILQMPVRQIGLMVNGFARAYTCGSRLFGLLDQDNTIRDVPTARPLEIGEGTLRFDNVSFAYPGTGNRAVLENVTFCARRGETIAIVGPPGSGKSTIAHLIPRFYDVTGGAIMLDGQDIRGVTLATLRKAVAVVQQDAFLFTTTIENNIAYGDPWAKEQRIERASESAQLHNYILGLPAGYKTVVGERGTSLSGGQRQRLTIARTMMLRPSVVIFDDSTAAIDAATEQRIRVAIRRFAKDRVTIIIAHRLSSLKHADRILFVDNGKIVERGTHQELLAKQGRYKALHDLQLRPGDDIVTKYRGAP
ncbi:MULTISPECIES: ABC transporter ATP-binding protein [Mesorhizobium]|uniref:ABC transporter ATP-binding protein n=1 Tax=Mesorhizobium TaxID=68287 RepID=UPI0007EDF172|nr:MULTISPECIES: ABC transporter ATP-binding protein [Mesorhizobium]TPJ43717.1 ABC transporter ATP-binding protein [Mesorhizobium sp. B2-6-6]ARP67344.1 multidrug ABC transporter [Mesorhizobium sp. WSM1497]MCA0002927.1 ABC transporter ATP-binding protein/permease [Mesorhizobium sp. B264B2A]MCA0009213.1 ABC transporter ATP-binding protein/permease [Mesorhizobium sp. B264B1B]MCA0013986.1 ABC transporter ATP-binding protein/permease [Mesorhizobium sp. B294B1A1]